MEISTILGNILLVVLARAIIYGFSKKPSTIPQRCDQTRAQLIDIIEGSTTSSIGKGTTYEELRIWVTKKGGFTT